MDQNETLSGQGAEQENLQGEPVNQNNQSMEALLENDAFSVELPQAGEIREGTIASISQGQILVSIGAKSEGVISGRELEVIDNEERDAFEVGQEIPVFVVSPEDSNGNVVLSYKRAQEQMAWTSVEEQMEDDAIIESKVIGYNKGGLIVGVHGLAWVCARFADQRAATQPGCGRYARATLGQDDQRADFSPHYRSR